MDRVVVGLVAGLLGGAVGGLAVGLVRPAPAPGPEGTPAASAREWREVVERLARIERALPPASVEGGLAGRPEAAEGGTTPAAEALLARMEDRLAGVFERKWTEMREKDGPVEQAVKARAKKRATLAEAAGEIGLSRSEEAEVRRIYDESRDKLAKILAEPDGDVETVRRDLEAAKTEAGRAGVMMKYVPKLLPKIGEVLAVSMERDSRLQEALGSDKAAQLDRYEVAEADPLGFGGEIRVEASER